MRYRGKSGDFRLVFAMEEFIMAILSYDSPTGYSLEQFHFDLIILIKIFLVFTIALARVACFTVNFDRRSGTGTNILAHFM